MDNNTLWKFVDAQFIENPQHLVSHHIESYNDFFNKDIYDIFRDKNPITIVSAFDDKLGDYKHKCNLYLGGKDGRKIYFGKPVIHDADNVHYMFPNEARLRNMTYSMTIHYDVEVEFIDIIAPGEEPYEIAPEFLGGEVLAKLGFLADVADDQTGGDYTEYQNEEVFKKELMYKVAGGGIETTEGGAPATTEKPPKLGRKKKQPAFAMTPAVAEALREAREKSMVDITTQKRTITLEKIYLGKVPIMVQSDFCILGGMPRELRYTMAGECRNDHGGYFIIQGKEKTVIMQEKFGDNMLYLKKGRVPTGEPDEIIDEYSHSIEIKSVSENAAKPKRTLSVQLLNPTKSYTMGNMVVNIPNVRAPVPLFVVFRALGITADKDIITMCLLDTDKYEFMMDAFTASVHDAGAIMQQKMAIQYIGELTKFHSADYAMEVLSDYFLPHIGETNYLEKAYFLGFMVFKLLLAANGFEMETDRDNLRFKRIELFGTLFRDLFQEYYTLQQKNIFREFDTRLYFNNSEYEHNLFQLVYANYREVFGKRILDEGIRKAFKGSWGAEAHTKRVGIVQDLNRLSFNSALAHLRKTSLPIDSSLKLVGPRILHNSHWGYIDFIDTPDGANIGIHKTLTMPAYVSRGYSRENMIAWLKAHVDMCTLAECNSPVYISTQTKVFVNGHWAGILDKPIDAVDKFRLFRRNGLIPLHTSIAFDMRQNIIYVYCDAGRVCRPIFYKDATANKLSFAISKNVFKRIEDGEATWTEMVSGFNPKRADAKYHINDTVIRRLDELYELKETEIEAAKENNPALLARFSTFKSVVEFVDPNEVEYSLIAFNLDDWRKNPDKQARYTHMEIHPSHTFGFMCNQVIFPECNPAVRISFSCSQSRQACSMYHTNYHLRMDKTAVLLNSGQTPILKSRYMKHINNEENPYGQNVIAAIMCFTGYNVEDAILINEGALQRGLFQTTYYTTYSSHEERGESGDGNTNITKFTNIEANTQVVGLKPGYDYSKLDANGLVREGTPVTDKTMLIGMSSMNTSMPGKERDCSYAPKKGQLGVVDRAFMTEGEEGERIAKVRVREIRIPNLGDKMASRAGQKGTVGMVIPEKDMPYTKDGIRPDIIINPHALPSRQTIGHLVECLIGKTCLAYGGFSDCTAFNNEGSKIGMFGKLLTRVGFHSSGNEILYDGMSGQQIDSEIFIGPNYYMRLKHMVKDKINYRALGPRSALTRQTVGGRANDGGLRIGEMERDVLIAHGINNFLTESMMDRGDKYQVAVCNTTGMIAIYNPAKKVFFSPMADGPVKFFHNEADNTYALDAATKYGRSFSIVSVPYSLKLLLQELQTMNISLRIITEDNINQIENMAFSDNIKRITLDKDMTPAKLASQMKRALQEAPRAITTPHAVGPIEEWPIEETVRPLEKVSPQYPDISPAYVPPPGSEYESPEYIPANPESPGYIPLQQPGQNTMYIPRSPDESPPQEQPIYTPYSPKTPPEYNGGGLNDISQYRLGQTVYYRRSAELDMPFEQPWKITKVGGRLLTIETDCPQANKRDCLQIVPPADVVPIDDPTFNAHILSLRSHTSHHQPSQYGSPMVEHAASAPAPVQFNPVIKIVTGNNNKVEGDTPASSEPSHNNIVGGGSNNMGSINNSISENSNITFGSGVPMADSNSSAEPDNKSSKSDKGIFGGLADFGKLVINKLV